jgi:hypothetical protein
MTDGLLNILDLQRNILDMANQADNVGVFNSMLIHIKSTCRLIDELQL